MGEETENYHREVLESPALAAGVCQKENPYHHLEWQFKDKRGCAPRSGSLRDRHKLQLLPKCINCNTPFHIPSLWSEVKYSNCHLTFSKMVSTSKASMNFSNFESFAEQLLLDLYFAREFIKLG